MKLLCVCLSNACIVTERMTFGLLRLPVLNFTESDSTFKKDHLRSQCLNGKSYRKTFIYNTCTHCSHIVHKLYTLCPFSPRDAAMPARSWESLLLLIKLTFSLTEVYNKVSYVTTFSKLYCRKISGLSNGATMLAKNLTIQ